MMFKNLVLAALIGLSSAAIHNPRALCGTCPEGQTCQKYGEMGGIYSCQPANKAKRAGPAMCGTCPEGETCQQAGEMGGIFQCQPAKKAKRDFCRPGAGGAGANECAEGEECVVVGDLIGRCQPVATEKMKRVGPGMCGTCPEGQTCQKYGEMGGIYRCQ